MRRRKQIVAEMMSSNPGMIIPHSDTVGMDGIANTYAELVAPTGTCSASKNSAPLSSKLNFTDIGKVVDAWKTIAYQRDCQ